MPRTNRGLAFGVVAASIGFIALVGVVLHGCNDGGATVQNNPVLTATSAICVNNNAGAPLAQSPDATKIPIALPCQGGKFIVSSWAPLRRERAMPLSISPPFQPVVKALCDHLRAGRPIGPGLQLTTTGGLLLHCAAHPFAAVWKQIQ